ncbi:DUF4998 domain-containing protein [Flavivirga eckloniae]|nr:DUF4998 domain-containing protein [Flavivirga eckloniae]
MNNRNFKYRNIRLLGILLILTLGFLIGCTKMDNTYEQFWKDGERIYPAPIKSVTSFSGFNRILLKGTIPKDPTVTKARVFWNYGNDSIEVPIASDRDDDTFSLYLEDMEESLYSFIIHTYDENGNKSIPVNAIGNSYGETYKASVLPRLMLSASHSDGELEIIWGGSSEASAIHTEIQYEGVSGKMESHIAKSDEQITTILNYDHSGNQTLKFRTFYLPDPTALDIVHTDFETFKVKGAIRILPKDNWTATASSFDGRNGTGRMATSAIDGDLSSIWVNQISPQTFFPHDITINLNEVVVGVEGIQILFGDRADTPKNIEIHGSKNGVDWSLMGTYPVLKNNNVQTFDLAAPEDIQYFKIVGLDSYGSNNIVIYEIWAFTR